MKGADSEDEPAIAAAVPVTIDAVPSHAAFMREAWFSGYTDEGEPVQAAVAWGLPKLCLTIGGVSYVVDVGRMVDQIAEARKAGDKCET
jgi:hypothetical protein